MAKLNAREKAKQQKAQKRAARDRMREAGLTTGDTSPYAAKVQRKRGSGGIDYRWMWWMSRGPA